MIKRPLGARAWVRAAGLAATVAVALVFAPLATEGGVGDRLHASVALSNRGPLSLCATTSDCSSADETWIFVYVDNKNNVTNELTHPSQFRTRQTLQNAFVVASIDEAIFVDGEHYSDATFRPPPNPDPTVYSGHWPSTVTCSVPVSPPCNVVGDPAILPGEKTAATFVGWAHVPGEPNGKYIFRYTVHGTLNGAPVDLAVSTPPIVMED